MDAAQYAGIIGGVNLWDLLPHYQAPANIIKNEWNHIRLVVSGRRMLVYVNDTNPTLEIPKLEGNTIEGKISFDGRCIISNLVIQPGETEGLSAQEGFDPTKHDPRYIRKWQVSDPQPLPRGREIFEGDFPKLYAPWKDTMAERLGMVNLTRLFGMSKERRFVWLRVQLVCDREQKRKVNFGFNDEVWVYLNRQIVFTDKNIFTSAGMRREPDGRISTSNSSFYLPLKVGSNELLVGVSNDFYGWAIIAQLDNTDGIQFTRMPDPQRISATQMDQYIGTYSTQAAPVKINIRREGNQMMAKVGAQPANELEYVENHRFRFAPANLVIEFQVSEGKMTLTEGTQSTTFKKE